VGQPAASVDDRESEAGMTHYGNTQVCVSGEVLTAADMNRITEYRHILIGEQGPETFEPYTVLTAKQLNEISESVFRHSEIVLKTCPNCGTSTHHKGFRPWEECDGCGAEWSGK
jgi:hypothetical protein